MGRRVVTVVCVVLAVGLVAAGLVVALRGGTGARVGLLLGAGLVAAAVGLATRPAPRASDPGWSSGATARPGGRWSRGTGGCVPAPAALAALGVALVPVGLLLDGLRTGAASAIAEGAAGTVVVGAVAGVLLARGLAHREVALTEEAVEIGAGRRRLALPWGHVHHLELPGERAHLADHERESDDCGER